jgi:hypothetical protein
VALAQAERVIRPDVHERFLRVVERAIAKADQTHAEHLARLRDSGRPAPLRRLRGTAARQGRRSDTIEAQ